MRMCANTMSECTFIGRFISYDHWTRMSYLYEHCSSNKWWTEMLMPQQMRKSSPIECGWFDEKIYWNGKPTTKPIENEYHERIRRVKMKGKTPNSIYQY